MPAAVGAARQAVIAIAPGAAWDIRDAGEVIARGGGQADTPYQVLSSLVDRGLRAR